MDKYQWGSPVILTTTTTLSKSRLSTNPPVGLMSHLSVRKGEVTILRYGPRAQILPKTHWPLWNTGCGEGGRARAGASRCLRAVGKCGHSARSFHDRDVSDVLRSGQDSISRENSSTLFWKGDGGAVEGESVIRRGVECNAVTDLRHVSNKTSISVCSTAALVKLTEVEWDSSICNDTSGTVMRTKTSRIIFTKLSRGCLSVYLKIFDRIGT